jgi:hypothetical protein
MLPCGLSRPPRRIPATKRRLAPVLPDLRPPVAPEKCAAFSMASGVWHHAFAADRRSPPVNATPAVELGV